MRARATTVLLVIAAIALPAVMAMAVFYASDQAIGDTPGGVTPQFGATVQPLTTVPKTAEREHHRRAHRGPSGSTAATTSATDDHGGSTSGRSPGGSGSSGGSGDSGSGSSGGSGGGGHGGDDGGGDS